MNKNIDLTKILKNCPKGTKLYSTIFGEVKFECIHNDSRTIGYKTNTGRNFDVTREGKYFQIIMESVLYFTQKTKEIGLNSQLLDSSLNCGYDNSYV